MAALIEWKDDFALGIAEVDHEHREIIALINETYELLGEGAANDQVEAFLAEVHARISAHFALEERLMRQLEYADYEDHKADHERLLDDILEIMDALEDQAAFDPDALANRLDGWFSVHFRTFDARLHAVSGGARP